MVNFGQLAAEIDRYRVHTCTRTYAYYLKRATRDRYAPHLAETQIRANPFKYYITKQTHAARNRKQKNS